jgi:hypothetical protein
MLNKISYSYFTLASLTALAQKITALLIAKLADNQMIAVVIARLQPEIETALQAIGSSIKQPLTEKVTQADLRRDFSFRSLRDHIRAGMLRQNEAYSEACQALWLEIEKNGTQLDRFARDIETVAIESLLNDLLKPEYEAYVKTTKISGWLEELNADNKAFVATSTQRSAARSSDDTLHDAEAFKAMKKSLDILEGMLTSLLAVNTPDDIEQIVAELSQYINEANTAAKQSGSKTKNEDDKPEEGED